MRYQGEGGAPPINHTQTRCVASLLHRGMSLVMVVEEVLDATVRAAGAAGTAWDWAKERRDIEDKAYRWIAKNPELADMLPDQMVERFKELNEAGKRPNFGRNPSGWFVRAGYGTKEEETPKEKTETPKEKTETRKPKVLVLRPWTIRDPANHPPRSFLYGRHYQRRTVGVTAGPGGGESQASAW